MTKLALVVGWEARLGDCVGPVWVTERESGVCIVMRGQGSGGVEGMLRRQ